MEISFIDQRYARDAIINEEIQLLSCKGGERGIFNRHWEGSREIGRKLRQRVTNHDQN